MSAATANDAPARRLPPAIVVGFGYAGAGIHRPALERLGRRVETPQSVVAVDPIVASESTGVEPVPVLESLSAAAEAVRPEAAVVHVCTPPEVHAATVAEAAALGFRRFIVEKPMVTSEDQLDKLLELERREGLDILVVSAWLTSRLTEFVANEIDVRRPVGVSALAVRQVKPRISRTLTSNSHASAFEVELPHELSLARMLVGAPLTLVDAYCSDLETVSARVEHMGIAELSLRSDPIPLVLCYSDLTAPHRERSVLVTWDDGTRLCGFYPCDRQDDHAQVMLFDAHGEMVDRRFIVDDAFDRFLQESYDHFAEVGPRPVSDSRLHAEVCRLLTQARTRCGVDEAVTVPVVEGASR